MAIFDRIRRSRAARQADARAAEHEPVALHLLPEINQRVTVAVDGDAPVSSRIEDVDAHTLLLARPDLSLDIGDVVVVSWERDDVWFTLETRVELTNDAATVPTIELTTAGRLRRFDEQRADVRRRVELDIELRVLRARAVRAGRDLHTRTTELGASELRFATTAQFAPGDLVEARIELAADGGESVSARLRITRVDTVAGTWRTICTATYDEILRSDRARLIAIAETIGVEIEPFDAANVAAPTTLDGVGGRDQPQELGDLEHVVEWLRRRR